MVDTGYPHRRLGAADTAAGYVGSPALAIRRNWIRRKLLLSPHSSTVFIDWHEARTEEAHIEDGDVEHLNMAAPGETLMEVVKYEPVSAGSSTFEKHRKSSSLTHLPSGLSLVQSQVGRRASAMQ